MIPSFTLKIRIGKIGVSPFPNPASCASISFSLTKRPSGEISVPKLMLEKGTCAPARECIVFKLCTKASIAWKVLRSVDFIASLYVKALIFSMISSLKANSFFSISFNAQTNSSSISILGDFPHASSTAKKRSLISISGST